MDQLEPVIKWIKKNVFWMCCGFLSLTMVGIWSFASGTLAEQTRKNTADVKKSINAVKRILSIKPHDIQRNGGHPNKGTEDGMEKELAATIDSIVEAWEIRKQAQEKILVWPKVIPNDSFVKFFGQYNPAETFPEEFTPGLRLADLLELYREKIPEQMIYLCGDEVLRTRWNFDPANLVAMETSTDEVEDEYGGSFATGEGIDLNKYAVIWSDKNQLLWNQKLSVFQNRDDNRRETNDPTPLQCYMLQQDLWLLEAMFKIIREVNGGSNANDLSVIKIIDHVVFGREAGGQLGELTMPDRRLAGLAAAAGTAKFGEPLDDDDDKFDVDDIVFGQAFTRDDNDPNAMTSSASLVPYHNRYVDVNFEPLPADVVQAVITGQGLPENNLELFVSKRVPVRIALKMDERRISDFMAACANSPFAFEIQQVRWNRHEPGGADIPLGGASTMIGSAGADKLRDMNIDMGVSLGSSETLVSAPIETRTSYDVNVEFYGIVKIYNPVRADELKKAAGLLDELDPIDAAATIQNSGSSESLPRP